MQLTLLFRNSLILTYLTKKNSTTLTSVYLNVNDLYRNKHLTSSTYLPSLVCLFARPAASLMKQFVASYRMSKVRQMDRQFFYRMVKHKDICQCTVKAQFILPLVRISHLPGLWMFISRIPQLPNRIFGRIFTLHNDLILFHLSKH